MLHKDHFTGAVSEHEAAAYYLKNGMQVYWPAVQQGHTDFVIELPASFKKVQVKTATWSGSGPHKYLQCRTRLAGASKGVHPKTLYDILFVVAPCGRKWEIPAELIDSSNIALETTGPKAGKSRWNPYEVTK